MFYIKGNPQYIHDYLWKSQEKKKENVTCKT